MAWAKPSGRVMEVLSEGAKQGRRWEGSFLVRALGESQNLARADRDIFLGRQPHAERPHYWTDAKNGKLELSKKAAKLPLTKLLIKLSGGVNQLQLLRVVS